MKKIKIKRKFWFLWSFNISRFFSITLLYIIFTEYGCFLEKLTRSQNFPFLGFLIPVYRKRVNFKSSHQTKKYKHTQTIKFYKTNATSLSGHMTVIFPPAAFHWVRMSLEGMDIIEVSLPVLDKSSIVCSNHPNTIVTPCHAANRTVMTLNKAHYYQTLQILANTYTTLSP